MCGSLKETKGVTYTYRPTFTPRLSEAEQVTITKNLRAAIEKHIGAFSIGGIIESPFVPTPLPKLYTPAELKVGDVVAFQHRDYSDDGTYETLEPYTSVHYELDDVRLVTNDGLYDIYGHFMADKDADYELIRDYAKLPSGSKVPVTLGSGVEFILEVK